MTEEKLRDIWDRRCGVLFKAWVQFRYHRRRQRFFDLCDKLTKATTLLLGASLFGGYVQSLIPWVATGISALGLLALVFGYGDRKQLHKELGEKSSALITAIEKVPASQIDDATNARWAADFAEIAGKSPPPLKALTLICEHEQACAEGHFTHVRRPNALARSAAHFM